MNAPFKKGDWVVEIEGGTRPMFGRVKEVYIDELTFSSTFGQWLIDLTVYGPDGGKVGRRSPPEGGPTHFEPCISANRFRKIEEPHFPLQQAKFSGGWVASLVK